jgi:hypothetical protein
MYCPRCGHQPISSELRFCSYCGFKLGVVKASLAEDDETNTSANANALPAKANTEVSTLPRHRNINIGVALMFLSSIISILINGREGGFGREGGGFILTAFFAVILLCSSPIIKGIYKLLSWGELTTERLSASQRELGFGAALMFFATAVSAVLSFVMAGRMRAPELTIGVLVAFVVLLAISPYVLRALRYLIREEGNSPKSMSETKSVWTLPPAQELPLPSFEAARVITAELGMPVASVTEHTTGLLREK